MIMGLSQAQATGQNSLLRSETRRLPLVFKKTPTKTD